MPVADFAAGVVVGAAASVFAVWLTLRLLSGRAPRRTPEDGQASPSAVHLGRQPGPDALHDPGTGSPALDVEPAQSLSSSPTGTGPVNSAFPVRISQRVLIHLGNQGALGADEVATLAFTQQGMAEALGASQGNLTGVLARLVAGGALQVDRRHVRDENRRLKVYRLTRQGEAIVRELRLGTPGRDQGPVIPTRRIPASAGPAEPVAVRQGNEA